jgi:hypothetical protein
VAAVDGVVAAVMAVPPFLSLHIPLSEENVPWGMGDGKENIWILFGFVLMRGRNWGVGRHGFGCGYTD